MKIRMLEGGEQLGEQENKDIHTSIGDDLRTPLNTIADYSQLGLSSEDLEEALGYMKRISVLAQQVQETMNNCTNFHDIGAGKMRLFMKTCDCEELMGETRNTLQSKAELKNQKLIFTEYAADKRKVFFDVQHLRQILVSMVENAIKYTPEGGMIECVTEALIPMNGFLPIHFLIKDNGIGMSQEFVEHHLFQAFEQENTEVDEQEGGSGLSLYIAKHLVDLMNGTIQCESIKGEGTIFHVSFLAKIVEDDAQSAEASMADDKVLAGKRILICDDHEINAILVERMFDKKKMLYEWAPNGKKGYEMYRDHEAGYYDAIIMDNHMPVLNGIETMQMIRVEGKEDSLSIPIVAMIANTDTENIEVCMAAGMTAHLTKPIDTRQVDALLSRLLV